MKIAINWIPAHIFLISLSSSNYAACSGVCASKSHDLKMQSSLSCLSVYLYRWWRIMLWKTANFRSTLSQIAFRFSATRSTTLRQQVFFFSPLWKPFRYSVSLFPYPVSFFAIVHNLSEVEWRTLNTSDNTRLLTMSGCWTEIFDKEIRW
jgi:hypothetical protein